MDSSLDWAALRASSKGVEPSRMVAAMSARIREGEFSPLFFLPWRSGERGEDGASGLLVRRPNIVQEVWTIIYCLRGRGESIMSAFSSTIRRRLGK